MLRPSLSHLTGQNTVCYNQVYDLLLFRTPIVTYKLTAVFILYSTKFMICYWSEHCMLRPSWWFVTGQNTVCYDQVYDLLLVRTLYGMTKFMICYWSENTVCYDQVYDLLLVRTLYGMTMFMIWHWSERPM